MSSDPAPSAPNTADTTTVPQNGHIGARRLAAGAGLILLLVFAAYWPALRGQFVWDDPLLVDENPLVNAKASLGSLWFQGDFPLTTVAFWIQWLLWGRNPAGYHAVNVLLHSASAVLLWRVLARLKIPGAWLGAAIFAVHPVCVASVAWISELKNTLSLPFYLLSIGWYLNAEDAQARRQRSKTSRWYCFSLAAFVLALLSKTSTVMLPVVLLGCVWWRRRRITRQDLWRTSPHFLLALAFGLMTVWFQAHQAIKGATVQTENLPGRLAGAGMAVWFYLGKAVLPLNLNMIYPRWEIDATSPVSYLPLALLCLGLAICWRFRRGWGRHGLFALGYFTVTLFPALGFFDMYFLAISRVSDHFQYLALIAVATVAGAALSFSFKPRVLRWVAPVPVLVLTVLTMQRAQVFATDEGLWQDTLAKNPAAWPAHNNLGCIRAEQTRMDEAIKHFETSLRLYPRNAKAHINLGKALALQNKFTEAETHFRSALEISPQDADAHKFYASALASQRRAEEAILHLREALRSRPDLDTHLQLAGLLHQIGRIREAIEQCRQALSIKADTPEALSNLAWLLATASDDSLRDGTEAVRLAEQACRLTGFKEARMVGTLAAAYAEAGRFGEAVSTARQAVELASSSGDVQFAAINQQLLRLYRAGKPYHESTPKKVDSLNR